MSETRSWFGKWKDKLKDRYGEIKLPVNLSKTARHTVAGASPLAKEEAIPQGIVTGTGAAPLHLRRGPGIDYAIIAKAENGAVCDLLGRNAKSDWLQIQCNVEGGFGWVSAAYIQSDTPLSDLPVSTAVSRAPAYGSEF